MRRIAQAAQMVLLLAPWLLATPAVLAQDPPACSGTFATRRRMVVECAPGFATQHDRITIYSRRDLDPAQPWQDQINDTDATWVFDAGADDRANLILRFEQQGEQLTASLFDDQDRNNTVSYRESGGQIVVTEYSQLPTVVVTASNSWTREDGAPNFNYDLQIDGPVEGMIDADQLYLDRLTTDGKIDLTAHVRDSDNDGRPDYEWRQAYPPLADADGFYHSSVMVNTAGDEPPIAGAIFWPLLGSGASHFVKDDYASTSHAPINIDWQRSKIDFLVESVASRNRPHNYFIYSIRRLKEGQINDVNFESPFAFYQFSPVQSNFPDLALRVAYYPPGDVAQHLPVEEIDFSWRQSPQNPDTRPNWDYRLGLTGHNAHQGQVTFPEFSLRITPYADLPRWVTSNSWDYATFVARESGNYLSSEGMYEWSTLEGAIVDVNNQDQYQDLLLASRRAGEDYVLGGTDAGLGDYYRQIRAGLRGEFRSRAGQPQLYFSPIDRKLHILGADHGVWQIDQQRTLRYANLDHDNYLDQWTFTSVTTGTTTLTSTRQLNVAPSHMLYADDSSLTIRQVRAQPSLFETLPPTDRAEWQALGARLQANQRQFIPDDLSGLLRQFVGPEIRLSGAKLRDYRPMGKDGFRFVLTLAPGFTANGAQLLDLQNLMPGEYVVTYDGRFRIEPLTPPALAATIHTRPLNQLEPSALQLTLRNDGLQDQPATLFELWAELPASEATLVATDTVTLLAHEPISLTMNWSPPNAGTWTLTPTLRNTGDHASAITLDSAQISVAPTQVSSADVLISASASFKTLPVIVAIALLFAGLAGYIWRQQWRLEGAGG